MCNLKRKFLPVIFLISPAKLKSCCRKNYFKEGDYIHPQFDAVEAYKKALRTWAKWIDENMDSRKLVFYRGFSSAHFRCSFEYFTVFTLYKIIVYSLLENFLYKTED